MTTLRLLKLAAGGASVAALNGVHSLRNLFPSPLNSVEPVHVNEILGTWYEIARKPIRIEKRSFSDISYDFRSHLHSKDDDKRLLDLKLNYVDSNGKLGCYHCQADVKNAADVGQFKIHYLPYAILNNLKPLQRQIFYFDRDQHVMLIGEPNRKFLWLLARQPHLKPRMVEQILGFAAEQGYDLNDIITVKHDMQSIS